MKAGSPGCADGAVRFMRTGKNLKSTGEKKKCADEASTHLEIVNGLGYMHQKRCTASLKIQEEAA